MVFKIALFSGPAPVSTVAPLCCIEDTDLSAFHPRNRQVTTVCNLGGLDYDKGLFYSKPSALTITKT